MVFPLYDALLGAHDMKDEYAMYMFMLGIGSWISLLMLFQTSTDFGLIDNLVGVALGIIVQLQGQITWTSVLIDIRYVLTNLNKWLGPDANADHAEQNQDPVVNPVEDELNNV